MWERMKEDYDIVTESEKRSNYYVYTQNLEKENEFADEYDMRKIKVMFFSFG
jgi:hypothetical protein